MENTVQLYLRELRAGVDLLPSSRRTRHPIVVLHGLFGSSDNWGTIGKTAQRRFTTWCWWTERDHGHSPHTEEYRATRSWRTTWQALVTKLGLRDIVLVGHSMGGKTAMLFGAALSGTAEAIPSGDRHRPA